MVSVKESVNSVDVAMEAVKASQKKSRPVIMPATLAMVKIHKDADFVTGRGYKYLGQVYQCDEKSVMEGYIFGAPSSLIGKTVACLVEMRMKTIKGGKKVPYLRMQYVPGAEADIRLVTDERLIDNNLPYMVTKVDMGYKQFQAVVGFTSVKKQ